MYDLRMYKVLLKKMHLGGRFLMLKYRKSWPTPAIEHASQVLVRTMMAGICASDLHQININLSYSASILARKTNPFPIGHEAVAEVVEVGESVKALKVGDRVVFSQIPHCAVYGYSLCPSCRKGHHETCLSLVGIGDGSELEDTYGGRGGFGGFDGGGFSEYFVGFEDQFTKIPSALSDQTAVLIEPFTVGIHAVLRKPPSDSDTVLIMGSGIIGLMALSAIRLMRMKCRIISVARYPFQGEAARRLGADLVVLERDREKLYETIAQATQGQLVKPALGKKILYGDSGPDFVYDTVGTDQTIDDTLHLVRSNGTVVLVGMAFGTTKKTDWALAIYKQLNIIGSMMHGLETWQGMTVETPRLALQLMESDPSRFEALVTHKFRLDDFRSAFRLAASKGRSEAIKVVFDYS